MMFIATPAYEYLLSTTSCANDTPENTAPSIL